MTRDQVKREVVNFIGIGLGLLVGILLFTFMSWVLCSIFSIAYSLPVALITAMCATFCLLWLSIQSVESVSEKIKEETSDLPPEDEPPDDMDV